ncbi:probable leucine-rich repeat receptor-like protein kinase IMK3 [Elaeis guineensis]|uniref:Probably inactive leucine-rich repeat receptor-like protein kinase IMK2 n=1 Tax=Elaeis guineensis var. tenera TaxID=51953 RepID=A0A6I9S6L2_ELAGV|nr:probably inactive leucine-rich repeat receptor-like protein kinase IMK2 [Elaeis guineensis]
MDKSHGLFDGFGEYRFKFSLFLMKNKARQCQISSRENRNIKYQSSRRSPFGKLFQWECLLALLGILPFMLISPVSCRGWDGVVITQADYEGLQAFKHELDDPRGLLRSWNGTGLDACSGAWVGIKCVRGKVIAIQLPWRGLGGHISEKVGQLTALRKLSLHDNSIGGQIPSALGFLRELRGVYLFNNRFSGTIPPSIGNCLVLQTLDLSNNLLTGSIPSSISNSTRLYRLNLSYNNLSGVIPLGVTRLPTLTFLHLQHNHLSASIPDGWGGNEVNKVYQLQILNLDYNFFSGSIPISLGKLPMLEQVTLSNNKLNGSIPEEMGTLPKLQTLDLSHNSLRGSFPPSLCNLSSLIQLNLESNHLENRIPETIDRLKNLSVLSLQRNQFDGQIPATLGNISSLSQLDLSENNLTGPIPASLDLLANLTAFNVSNNNLSGPVPVLLSEKFNSSSFRGNILLCGYSILVPCPSPPHPHVPSPTISTVSHHRKLSTKDIILIAAGIVLLFLFLLSCALLCCLVGRRAAAASDKSTAGAGAAAGRGEKPGPATGGEAEAGGDAGGKLVHFDGPLAFTADDLLCATAEIMGKSTYGTVYKATLEDGSHVAVKRLREKMVKHQRDFEAEVSVLGKIRHPNLLGLKAYYLGPKGEKLLVFDYMPKGSLAAFLHARGPDIRIDWPTRMNVAMAVARGLCHLHVDMKMIHGNITSTNILLDENTNAKIADFGLSRLMTGAASSSVIATAGALGYRAPELSKLKKANTKTDVYSLGVIMLELLTGKSPGETTNGMDLPQWVASIVKEEWTNEVFDLELMRDAEAGTTTGDELLNTLKLALHCVDPSPAARPEVQQVLQQLEQIKPELAAAAGSSMEEGGGATAVEASETGD